MKTKVCVLILFITFYQYAITEPQVLFRDSKKEYVPHKEIPEDYLSYKDDIQKQVADLDAEYLKNDSLKMIHARNPNDPLLEILAEIPAEIFKENMLDQFKHVDPKFFAEQVVMSQERYEVVPDSPGGATTEISQQNYGFEPKDRIPQWEIKERLSEQQYLVTQFSQGEYPYSGDYNNFFGEGNYNCIVCDEKLFKSDHKYNTTLGFAAFNEAIGDIYELALDFGKINEARCKNCGAYLGDIVDDPKSITGKGYLVNSASIRFQSGQEFIQ